MSIRLRHWMSWCYLVVPVFLAWLAIGYIVGSAMGR